MIRHVVVQSDPDHYRVEIPIRQSQISAVVSTLNLIGVPAVRPPGGPGYLIEPGCVTISGNQTAVEKALKEIDYHLNGPKFENALTIAERHKKGALP